MGKLDAPIARASLIRSIRSKTKQREQPQQHTSTTFNSYVYSVDSTIGSVVEQVQQASKQCRKGTRMWL